MKATVILQVEGHPPASTDLDGFELRNGERIPVPILIPRDLYEWLELVSRNDLGYSPSTLAGLILDLYRREADLGDALREHLPLGRSDLRRRS